MNQICIWPVRREAEALALHLAELLPAQILRPWQMTERQSDAFAKAFSSAKQWVFIGASGIATRFLAHLPQSKYSDPAVVVLDEAARFAIPLLGGHEGGANALAYQISRLTGAIPAITTATEAIKPLTVGLGSRHGVNLEQVEQAIFQALGQHLTSEIREVVTVDLKAKEAGILAFCEKYALPLRILAHADLEARPFVTQASDWVQQNVGLPGVCEPCALIASPRGRLIVPKMALNGVTVAIVEDQIEDQGWKK